MDLDICGKRHYNSSFGHPFDSYCLDFFPKYINLGIIFFLWYDFQFTPYASGVIGGGWGSREAECPIHTSDQKISADLSEKKEARKKGKMERKKKEN